MTDDGQFNVALLTSDDVDLLILRLIEANPGINDEQLAECIQWIDTQKVSHSLYELFRKGLTDMVFKDGEIAWKRRDEPCAPMP